MSARSAVPFVAVAVVLAVGLAVVRRSAAPTGTAPPDAGSADTSVLPAASPRTAMVAAPEAILVEVDPRSGALVRADNRTAAGRRTTLAVARCDHGIRCPDGSFLPLLNGVDSAPPILRAEERGPLPPVVAIVVDRDGWDWYEHADGSTTTCRPQRIFGADGRGEIRVLTLHNVPDPSMTEIPPDVDPARSR